MAQPSVLQIVLFHYKGVRAPRQPKAGSFAIISRTCCDFYQKSSRSFIHFDK
jgi:hypothetical protein